MTRLMRRSWDKWTARRLRCAAAWLAMCMAVCGGGAGAAEKPADDAKPAGGPKPTVEAKPAAAPPKQFYDPVVRQVEGWTVKVDPKLLEPENASIAEPAFKALANHLQRIVFILPQEKVAELRRLPIWLELHNPTLANMQYHPDRGWLVQHGHDPRLVKHVHIPRAKQLFDPRMWAKHPYVVLHELAHAYHDQVLGFDNEKIRAAFEDVRRRGVYEKVLLYTGRKVRHYALTNHKEYFAESTEAYLGVNDFYPFVRAELKEVDPRMFAIQQEIWGPIR